MGMAIATDFTAPFSARRQQLLFLITTFKNTNSIPKKEDCSISTDQKKGIHLAAYRAYRGSSVFFLSKKNSPKR
jgi:hypothetical protein